MKKIEKLLMMNWKKISGVWMTDLKPTTESVLIYNQNEGNEYYIDSRTTRNEKGLYQVKPIAENDRFIWYICPFCNEIHIESKRCLNVNNKILYTNCRYRGRVLQYITLDCEINPIAFQEVTDLVLEQEWKFMQAYEESWCK